MKKLLPIISMITTMALIGPALPFTSNDTVELDEGYTALVCYPTSIIRTDRDPVVRTYITIDLDAKNDYTARSLMVVHELLSGRMVNRDDQYTGKVFKDYGKAQWYWTGILNRNPNISIMATLYKNNQMGWRYQEIILNGPRIDVKMPEMVCVLGSGDVS